MSMKEYYDNEKFVGDPCSLVVRYPKAALVALR